MSAVWWMKSHRKALPVTKLKLQVWGDTEDDLSWVKCFKCVLSHLLTVLWQHWGLHGYTIWSVACKEPISAQSASGSTEGSGLSLGSPMTPRISRTFRMIVLSSSSRINASVCFQGVEVMESCSQRPTETHVVHGPGQLKHTEDSEVLMDARPDLWSSCNSHLELFVCGESKFLQQDWDVDQVLTEKRTLLRSDRKTAANWTTPHKI